MPNRDPDVYVASDYAGMTAGDWSFYYGYEFGYMLAGSTDDEDESAWGFIAERRGERVTCLSLDEMRSRTGQRLDDWDNCQEMLLVGIGLHILSKTRARQPADA